MKRELTIAAYLGVKDEAEIIEQQILHLRAIGIDRIIVCDMSSTDGTLAILSKHKSEYLSVFSLGNSTLNPQSLGQQWHIHAWRRYAIAPCDWIIFLDADEFWLPASGRLKDCKGFYSADALIVDRFNVMLGPTGPFMTDDLGPDKYDQIYLCAKPVHNFRIAKQTHAQSTPWIMGAILPKVAVRRSKIGAADDLHTGQHDIDLGVGTRRERPDDLLIAHLPLSTRTRFERKVVNIRSIYDDSGIDLSVPDETWERYGTAWHWRRWATMSNLSLSKEFDENVLSIEETSALKKTGTIVTAHDLLSRRVPRRADSYVGKKCMLIEIEYEATFRPFDLGLNRDRRLPSVKFKNFDIICAATGTKLGQFDIQEQSPASWRPIYGLGFSEPAGRWGVGPRSSLLFSLNSVAPETIRVEIEHQLTEHAVPRVPARVRINGGDWRMIEFTGGIRSVEFDLNEGRSAVCAQNQSLLTSGQPVISIIMVDYGQPEQTFAAVLAIERAKIRTPYEIIVVEHGLAPSPACKLVEMDLPSQLIQVQKRISFGTASNLGAEAARGEFLIFLNNDAFLDEGVVEKLQEALSEDSVGLVGPVYRSPDDSIREMGAFISANGISSSPLFNGLGWSVPRTADVDHISGACVMLRRSDFLAVGGFDPEFEFGYYDDVDLCLRLRGLGKYIRLITSASVRHIQGTAASQLDDKARLENLKTRDANLLRSRWTLLPTVGEVGFPARQRFDPSQIERQIAYFPGESALNRVISQNPLSRWTETDATLAHAAALGQLRPTMVAGPSEYAVLDICSSAAALGLEHVNLTSGYRAELERRDVDVVLVSGTTWPPATTPRHGRKRILHCPVPTSLDDASVNTHRRRIGNLLNFDVIVTDSPFGRRACAALLARLGAPAVDIAVIWEPVDTFTADERAGVRDDIVVSMGPLRPGRSGGAHELALRVFRAFATAQKGRRWRLVVVGGLSAEDDSQYIQTLRRSQPEFDVDVLVNPPRPILRRLLLRSKVYLSARGYDAPRNDVSAFTHTMTQVGAAISAGCVPVVFDGGAEAEFCKAHDTGYVFRDERDLATALSEATERADAGGLPAAQCEKMQEFDHAVHAKAWAQAVSRLELDEGRDEEDAAALVVAGCHRSGTSAMARVLSIAGADLPSDLMVSASDNSTGFWEPAAVVAFNEHLLASRGSRWDDEFAFANRHSDRLDEADIYEAYKIIEANYGKNRPIVLKDPRISISVNLWNAALRSSQYHMKYIIMVRDPREVAASLNKRNGFSIGKGLMLWVSYMLSVERDTISNDRIFVSYEDLLVDPVAMLDRIASSLRIAFPRRRDAKERIVTFIAASQRHHEVDAAWSDQLTEPVGDYFRALTAASRDEPLSSTPGERLEAWMTDFARLLAPKVTEG